MIHLLIACALALPLAVLGASAHAAVDVQEVVSPGGVRAWLVAEPSIPFVALEIRIRGGANLDREGKRGSVSLMAALLGQGAGSLDARAFQEAREAVAASFGFAADDDVLAVSATMLSENRDEAVALLRAALVEPRFDADAIERQRGQALSGIASDAQDPQAIAGDAFNRAAFGDHPYGSPLDGSAESVAALTREDIWEAHADTLVRGRVFVAAVGDITPEALGALLDDLLGPCQRTGPRCLPTCPWLSTGASPSSTTPRPSPSPSSVTRASTATTPTTSQPTSTTTCSVAAASSRA